MLSVAIKPIMLIVILLNVNMLKVMAAFWQVRLLVKPFRGLKCVHKFSSYTGKNICETFRRI
jgi:hypothetical protein